MLGKDHDGIVVTGKRKKGKSYLTKQLYANEKRVVLYDAKGELIEPTEIEAGQLIRLTKRGIVRVSIARRNRPAEELEWSAYLAIALGNCVYVADELPDALEDGEPGESFKWVIRMGRKRNIRFICTFQRPAEIPRMVTAQASDMYFFQTNEPNDLEYVRKSCGKDAQDVVRNLPNHVAAHYKDGSFVAYMKAENWS